MQKESLPPPLERTSLSAAAFNLGHWLKPDDGIDDFDLDAPYQRGSVWTIEQRRALVKSLLMGVPTGALIISVLPDSLARYNSESSGSAAAYRVIDGKQRIEAIRAWVGNQVPVPGWWLPAESLWAGEVARRRMVIWSDLTEVAHRKLRTGITLPMLQFDGRMMLCGHDANGRPIWKARTPEQLLQAEAEVFVLVNSAGVAQDAATLAEAATMAGL